MCNKSVGLGIEWNIELRSDGCPLRIRRLAGEFGCTQSYFQVHLSDGVCVYAVVHEFGVLIGWDDLQDLVSVVGERRPADPIVRSGFYHRKAAGFEPAQVSGCQIILPLCQGNVAVDVPFISINQARRSVFRPGFSALPGIFCPRIAAQFCVGKSAR